jgi:hypothetical protein
LVLAPLVSAQQSSWLTDSERARFEELRRSGLDALYNIDYDKAQREFKEIVRLYPVYSLHKIRFIACHRRCCYFAFLTGCIRLEK